MSGEHPDSASDETRSRAILSAARDTEPGETPGDVRRRFLEAIRRSDLIDAGPPRRRADIRATTDGTVILTFELRSAVDVRRLLKCAGMGRPALAGWAAQFLANRARIRDRRRQPETIARALAIHYLSKQAGGRLTLEKAAARYQAARLPWRDTWRTERRDVVREIERDIGPLWLSSGETITGA